MTSQPATKPDPSPAPVGVRIASTLCWLVGAIAVLAAFVTRLTWPWRLANIGAGGLVIGAGVLTRRRRRTGVYLVALGWALPSLIGFATGGGARPGSMLLVIAEVVLVANWRHLR